MFWNLAFFCTSVLFMTVLSLLYGSDTTRCTKGLYEVLFSFCMNLLSGILLCGIWAGNWNLLEFFGEGTIYTLSYQQFFDYAIALLILYVESLLTGWLMQRLWRASEAKRKKGKLLHLGLSSGFLLLVSISLFVGIQGNDRILISEIYLPDKKTTLEGQNAYIEVVNNGRLSYETGNLYLSDDINHLKKYPISGELMSPKEAIKISLDYNVFDFGKKGGDVLVLSNQYGEIVDTVVTGDTRKNKSYTRNYTDKTWEYRDPSPGAYNLEKPRFSIAPGFYDEAFYVELSGQDNVDIYYTWDGSTPTAASERYEEKILIYDRSEEQNQYRSIRNVTRNWLENEVDPTPVPKATVIRAIAVNPDGAVSEIATATYFVNQKETKDHYVVSLVADPDDLFGAQGIYSTGEAYDQWYLNGKIGDEPKPNFERRGLECMGNFELFHATEYGYLSQLCGIRIQGGSHRGGTLKRMSVFAREEYNGSKFFDQNIFENRKTHSVALRAGFTNAVEMEMVPERSLATQKSIPVRVFLNGEYWYDTYLQEKYSDEHFEEVYHLEEVEFRKAGVTEELLTFVDENDMKTEDAYQRLEQMVDIQSYIDFMCANIYLANTDYAEATSGGNSAIWRSMTKEDTFYGDGRWRWALYDLDLVTSYCRGELGLNDITDAQLNTFVDVRPWTRPLEERPFYSSLKKNPQFRQQFVLSFMDMANTCFAPDNVGAILEKWGEDLSFNNSFFLERNQYITQYLADAYDLTGTQETLSVEINDPEAGFIQVNTCRPDLADGSWSGNYYTDYPVTVTAEAYDGYRFVRWEGDMSAESSAISFILPEGGVSVRAVYEPDEK